MRWHNVATLAVTILLAGDVITTLLGGHSTSSASLAGLPFRLWTYPYVAAIAQQLALLATAYYLRSDVPVLVTILAIVTFGSGAAAFAAFQPGLVRRLSRTTAVKNTWTLRSQRPHDAGVRAALFIGGRLRTIIFAVLAIFFARAAYKVRPGESLRDLRLAVIIVLIVTLLGLAMRERVAPILLELRDLRRNVTLDRVSPSDATDAFLAIVAGISGAPYVIAKCREAIEALHKIRLEADSTLQEFAGHGSSGLAYREIGDLHERVVMLDSTVQQVWSVTKAQQSMYAVLRPQSAQLLSRILVELEAELDALHESGRALTGALEADQIQANPTRD